MKQIEEIIRASDAWEPVGPTPCPDIADLRNWDMRLLKTYKPFYAPFCDLCCLCTFGKCDLTGRRRGACGIDIAAQQGRIILLYCCLGLSAHGSHARYIIDYLIDKYGEDYRINLGSLVNVEAPIIRTVLGLKPETLGDLRKAMDYVEHQLVHLVSSLHTGQEGSSLDFESKALHAGMLDHVAMEAADIAQIVGFNYPASVAETPIVECGWGTVDKKKPVILCIGHNPATPNTIIDYLTSNGLRDKVEVVGICCSAQELARYYQGVKVVGPLSQQLFFVRTGIADVIIADEQCVRTDLPHEARKVWAVLIAVTDKICYGLEDKTECESEKIVEDLVEKVGQVLILRPDKAAEVAVKTALKISPLREKRIISEAEAIELSGRCRNCQLCDRECPNLLPIGEAVQQAGRGDLSKLVKIFERCIGCGRCEQACPLQIPVFKLMQAAASMERFRIRSGRGPIQDVEIRRVGASIVLGTIPGVVAFVGCSNFPQAGAEVSEMMEEFAQRKYIVVTSGCTAMAAAMTRDREGKTIYEKYPPSFDAGGIVNVGSCVANSHIAGAAIKIANIFASLPLRANYEVIADYILNRVGACGVVWGAMSQKAIAIATGFNRLGIPVIMGPHGSKYRRLYLSNKGEDDWTVMDARKGELINTREPAPEHLLNVIETKERAMVEIAKLCIRHNDTPQGRSIKLNHYISLWKKYMGDGLPDDLHLFIRRKADIPLVYRKEVEAYLNKIGWKEKAVVGLPTLIGTYPTKVRIEAVIK